LRTAAITGGTAVPSGFGSASGQTGQCERHSGDKTSHDFLPFNVQDSDVAYDVVSRHITDYEHSRSNK
jgi:hypothetical protein